MVIFIKLLKVLFINKLFKLVTVVFVYLREKFYVYKAYICIYIIIMYIPAEFIIVMIYREIHDVVRSDFFVFHLIHYITARKITICNAGSRMNIKRSNESLFDI